MGGVNISYELSMMNDEKGDGRQSKLSIINYELAVAGFEFRVAVVSV